MEYSEKFKASIKSRLLCKSLQQGAPQLRDQTAGLISLA
jgi:hypothetical protein